MSRSEIARSGFEAILLQIIKIIAQGLIPFGDLGVDAVSRVLDDRRNRRYLTREEFFTAIMALSPRDRDEIRQDVVRRHYRELTPGQRATVAETIERAESVALSRLLEQALVRDESEARASSSREAARLRGTIQRHLGNSRYRPALRAANELAELTPGDPDVLELQNRLEKQLGTASVDGLLTGLFVSFWAFLAGIELVDVHQLVVRGPAGCIPPGDWVSSPCWAHVHDSVPPGFWLEVGVWTVSWGLLTFTVVVTSYQVRRAFRRMRIRGSPPGTW